MHALIEFLPTVLAPVTAVSCAWGYTKTRRWSERWGLVFGCLACLLLIMGQTSWWVDAVDGLTDEPRLWIVALWKTFDGLMMASFIASAWRDATRGKL